MSELGRAACNYAQRGWAVLPIVPRGKVPLTAHGLKDASTDLDVIGDWWTDSPDANIGVCIGPPGPTVIDCDGPIGRHEWLKFIAGIGWQASPWVLSGGGWHIFYSGDATIKNRVDWLTKVDVCGVGGYVVAPPSTHINGNVYEWDASPDERELQEIPDRVRDALAPKSIKIATTPGITITRPVGNEYANAALDGELANVRGAVSGTRNHTLNAAAFSLGTLVATGELDIDSVVTALLAAAVNVGLPGSEAARTIESGLRAGMQHPRNR